MYEDSASEGSRHFQKPAFELASFFDLFRKGIARFFCKH